jgi:hypothetical protein
LFRVPRLDESIDKPVQDLEYDADHDEHAKQAQKDHPVILLKDIESALK